MPRAGNRIRVERIAHYLAFSCFLLEIVLHKMVDGLKKKMDTQDTNRRLCKIELDLKTTQIAPPTFGPKRWLFRRRADEVKVTIIIIQVEIQKKQNKR